MISSSDPRSQFIKTYAVGITRYYNSDLLIFLV
jgi:hypothetical protein